MLSTRHCNLKAVFGVGVFKKSVDLKDCDVVGQTSSGEKITVSLDELIINLLERIESLEEVVAEKLP